jgi:general secretion pathway protein G
MEVLLVLAILVILGSLAVFAFGNAKMKANIDSAKSQIGLLSTPINMYLNDYNQYPDDLSQLRNPPARPNGQAAPPYIENDVPLDPWNNPYQYHKGGQHHPDSYDLYSLGPNGVEDANVIGNW